MPEKSKSRSRIEYEQGIIFSLGVLITGMLLEWITKGRGTGIPSWPLNMQVGLSFIIVLVFIHIYYRDLNVVKWISRVPAAISSIALFSILVLFMGLISQDDPDAALILRYTGLSHVRNSYPLLLSGLYLLTSLGLVILRKISPFTFKNFGFLLNHAGLWIIVFAGSLGAGDMKRLNIYAQENETIWYGYDSQQQIRELPFSIKLLHFTINEYNPKLAYIHSHDLSFPAGIKNNLRQIEPGLKVTIEDWEIEVAEFYMMSQRDSSGYFPSEDTLAVPSALIHAVNEKKGLKRAGWISCGNFKIRPELLELDELHSMGMTTPEPKTYNSLIEVITRDGEVITHDLQVNKPLKISGWNLYQLSYDERFGKWSSLSIIEAIRDPWLIIVYFGIFMVLAGALYLFWLGKN